MQYSHREIFEWFEVLIFLCLQNNYICGYNMNESPSDVTNLCQVWILISITLWKSAIHRAKCV